VRFHWRRVTKCARKSNTDLLGLVTRARDGVREQCHFVTYCQRSTSEQMITRFCFSERAPASMILAFDETR
jgi:hypothetical protein